MNRVRIEVTDRHGTVALILDPPNVPPSKQARLTELAGQAISQLAALPGVTSEEHARQILLCTLTRRHADETAYERVAQQRGLLAL
jgi:hypothetical protein